MNDHASICATTQPPERLTLKAQRRTWRFPRIHSIDHQQPAAVGDVREQSHALRPPIDERHPTHQTLIKLKQFSSGVVEGLNNKAKVTMRKSYGFRTLRVLELALYHSLAKLPEPQLTHDFF